MKKLFYQVVMVTALGVCFGLAANALSPRGLELRRDYFPGAKSPTPPKPPVATNHSPAPNAVTPASPEDAVMARLRGKGLQPITFAEVRQLREDPRFELEQIVFVDDRDDAHYSEGHIPGAFQFFHYRPEQHLPALLPVVMRAEVIVVYCAGGDCEDSEFAALMLRDAGIPADKLRVYVGGIKEWQAKGLPQETGGRNSGRLIKSAPQP